MTHLIRTTAHLTGAELHRLLHRYDLTPAVAEAIWLDAWEEADCLAEILAEQRAEGRGHWRRHGRYQTRLEAFWAAHPLHTCATAAQAGYGFENDDKLPF